MSIDPRDEALVREALIEGDRGHFTTFPNPAVGAVLVRDGQIVARGHHEKAGGPHAEVACLADARAKGIDPKGLTMAVTLEPCNHTGRTGPCSEALLAAGIARVVVGMPDLSAKAHGGAARLASAGVEVVGHVLEPACRLSLADWLTWSRRNRPFVFLKLAATLDGRIATRTGHSRWVTGEEARASVHQLRANIARTGGCVLVGGETFRRDNPDLRARGVHASGPQPRACVFARVLPKPEELPSRVLTSERAADTFFFLPADAAERQRDRVRALEAAGARVLTGPEDTAPRAQLSALLSALWKEGVPYVLCEGGGRLALMLLEAGLVDLYFHHLSPSLLGDNLAAPLFDGRAPSVMDERLTLLPVGQRPLGRDLGLAFVPSTAWYARDLEGLVQGDVNPFFGMPQP